MEHTFLASCVATGDNAGVRHAVEMAILRGTLRLPRALLRSMAGPLREGREHCLDAQVQVLLKLATRAGLTAELMTDVSTMRQRFDSHSPETGVQIPRGVTVTEHHVPGVSRPLRVRVYRPDTHPASLHETLPAIVYYHGGGFVLGSLDSHDPVCRKLCLDTDCVVLAVDYRLAPEHPFPAPAQDAIAAFHSIVQQADALGVDRTRLAVAGDSSGANLATVVTQTCVQRGDMSPCFQLLFYPCTDNSREWPSYQEFAQGLFLTRAQVLWFRDQYLPVPGDRRDPRASPLLGEDLSGLPPTWIGTAGFDPLVDEGDAYAERLQQAGVDVTHHRHPSLVHGYVGMAGVIDAARHTVEQAHLAVRQALQPEPPAAKAVEPSPSR